MSLSAILRLGETHNNEVEEEERKTGTISFTARQATVILPFWRKSTTVDNDLDGLDVPSRRSK